MLFVCRTPAYTLGIFQSIGFKEFHDYLILSEEEKTSERGEELFKKGVELMKIATKQYARRQLKWIRKRFLGRELDQVWWELNLFELDLPEDLWIFEGQVAWANWAFAFSWLLESLKMLSGFPKAPSVLLDVLQFWYLSPVVSSSFYPLLTNSRQI